MVINKIARHQKTIAIDLDGTILKYDRWRGAKHFGEPLPGAVEFMQKLYDDGWFIIIWTTRGNTKDVKNYLNEKSIVFDTINVNPNQPKGTSQKVIADAYLDDRAIRFTNWPNAYKEIRKIKKHSCRVKLGQEPAILPDLPPYIAPVPKIESTLASFGIGNRFIFDGGGESYNEPVRLKIPEQDEELYVYVDTSIFDKAFNLDPNVLTAGETINPIRSFIANVYWFDWGSKQGSLLLRFLKNAITADEMKQLGCIGFRINKKIANSIKSFIKLENYINTIESTIYGLGDLKEIKAFAVLKNIVANIIDGKKDIEIPKAFMKRATSYLGKEVSNSALDIMEFCIEQIAPVIAKTGSIDLIDVLDLMIRTVDGERGKIYRSWDTFPVDYGYITGYSTGI